MFAKEVAWIVRHIMMPLTLYTAGALLSHCGAHDMKCSGFENANGSATYSFSDGLSSVNCSTQWSDSGKVIAYIEEGKKAQLENVLVHDVETLTLSACWRNVSHKKECPELGVSIDVPCPCNCSDGPLKTTPNHLKVKGNCSDGPLKSTPNHLKVKGNCSDGPLKSTPNHLKVKDPGGSNRNRIAVIAAVVIFGVVVLGLVCWLKCEIGTGTNPSAGTITV